MFPCQSVSQSVDINNSSTKASPSTLYHGPGDQAVTGGFSKEGFLSTTCRLGENHLYSPASQSSQW